MKTRFELFFVLGLWTLPACSRGPDASRPWVVVLDTAAQQREAEARQLQLAEKLKGTLKPQLIELQRRGLQYFIIAPPPSNDRLQAEDLARRLEPGLRLPVLDLRELLPRQPGRSISLDTAPALEIMLALLPAPVDEKLHGLQLLAGRQEQCSYRAFARWSYLFGQWCHLGFENLAEAVYTAIDGSDVLVLAGLGAQDPGRLREAVASLVLDQLVPDDEEWHALQKARRAPGKKPRRPPLVEENKAELSPARTQQLPWGRQEIFSLERFFPEAAHSYRPGQKTYRAWLVLLEQEAGALLALAEEERHLHELFRPRGLGPARGVRFDGSVLDALSLSPEALPEGEALARLQIIPAYRLAGIERKTYEKALCHRLEFRGQNWFWRISRIELADRQQVQRLYESAFVETRRRQIQSLLESKQKISHQISLQLLELGDITGWHFRGAGGDRSEEIYFQKDNAVFWLEAEGISEDDPEGGGLPGRVGLLPIW